MSTSSQKPWILGLAPDRDLRKRFLETHAPLMRALKDRATVRIAVTVNDAMMSLIERPPPLAVLVADHLLSLPSCGRIVMEEVEAFVRVRGGTVIFMGHFPTYTDEKDMNRIFSRLGAN